MKTNSGLLSRHPDACIIAVDPGISGAVAFLFRGAQGTPMHGWNTGFVERMPVQRKKSGRHEIDVAGLIDLIGAHAASHETIFGAIEQVSAMPGQGVSSMFSLGDSYGSARALLALFCHRVDPVSPARWKRALGLTKDKSYSLTLARRFFPELRDTLKLQKDEGKAEALLLAHYANQHLF